LTPAAASAEWLVNPAAPGLRNKPAVENRNNKRGSA
jgi:hypothetical protein